jgi:hypothetical protein
MYPPVEMPTADDDAEQLKSKWEAWTASESRKRYISYYIFPYYAFNLNRTNIVFLTFQACNSSFPA